MTGHYCSTTWGTNPTRHGESSEVRTFFGKPIDVRGLHIGMTMATEVTPAPVVGKNEDDVWFGCPNINCNHHAENYGKQGVFIKVHGLNFSIFMTHFLVGECGACSLFGFRHYLADGS